MKLSDCCIKIGSGATPRGGKESYLKTGPFSLIRSQNVHNNIFLKSGLAFISEEQASQLQNVEVKSNDVLLNITGDSVARVCQVPDDVLPARVNQHVAIIRPDSNKLFHKYLHYFLVNPQMQSYMLSLASAGATRNALTKSMIESFELPRVHLSEQKAIASVLSELDDKIENNNQMNETLESMVHAIFKSWFVHFDPVHAKVAGNAPAHMDEETAAIFPNSFANDGLPVGWKNSCISKLAFRVKDKFERGQKWDNEKLIDLGRMPSNSIALNEFGKGKELSTSINIFKKNDFLFGSIRPYFCKAGLAPFNGITNSSVFILRCHENKNRAFLYALCSSQNIFNKSIQYSKGTKMPIISWTDFSKFECVDPSQVIRDVFSSVTIPMFDRIQNNVSENHTLAELRDTLLPKLISGEIRVKDAEREVEAAV